MKKTFTHSVFLKASLCTGCINCIKRCPTEAIRVRHGKACITSQFCIDCGECANICPHHAKLIRSNTLAILDQYEYTVVLPEPSMYAQFNNLDDIDILLTALLGLGFNDVFEVGVAAELVSEESRKFVREHPERWPIISTSCPSVARLIRIRFPNLIEHLLPINTPVEVAATFARKQAMKKTGLPADKIGIISISPCASKITHAGNPIGKDHSEIDAVLSMKDLYPLLLPLMKEAQFAPDELSSVGRIGVGWGYSGGEAGGIMTDKYMAADGIENVMRVLEGLEDEKFENLEFIELNACNGGCVGGVLNIENPYVAEAKLKNLNKYLPVALNHICNFDEDGEFYWNEPVVYEPVFRIGKNMIDSINKMKQIDALCKQFPQLDCGSCGAPTCRALAEDIARGQADKNDCIHILRAHLHRLAKNYNQIAHDIILEGESPQACISMLTDYLDKLSAQILSLDAHQQKHHLPNPAALDMDDPISKN